MAVIDYVILAVIVISALVSFARGFLREALSIAAWTIAIVCAFHFAPQAAPLFAQWLADTTLQYWAAVVAVFLLTLLVCGIVNWLIAQFFSEFGTSGTDRSLGILLGAARGAVVVALLLLGGKVISLPLEKWGENAKIYPHFSQFSEWLWTVGSDMAANFEGSLGPQEAGSGGANSGEAASAQSSAANQPTEAAAGSQAAPSSASKQTAPSAVAQ